MGKDILRVFIQLIVLFSICYEAIGDFDLKYAFNYFSSPAESYLNPNNTLNLRDTGTSRVQFFSCWKLEFFDGAIRLKLSDNLNIYPNGGSTDVTNKINEILISLSPYEWVMLSLGKEVVRSGVGFFKNPSDFLVERKTVGFESKEDSEKYLEGRILVDLQFFISSYSLQFILSPSITWNDESNKVLKYLSSQQETYKVFGKFAGNFYGVDTVAVLCYDGRANTGLNLAYVLGENLELHFEGSLRDRETQKLIREMDVTVDLGFTNIKVGTTNGIEERELHWVPRVVLGGHYTFSESKVMLMIEYFYNGIGLDGKEWFSTLDEFEKTHNAFSSTNLLEMASLNTYKTFLDYYGITGITKHYGMFRVYKEFEIPLSLEIILIKNLVDFSGYLINRWGYSFDIGLIEIGIGFPYGGKKSEFGLSLDRFVLFSSLKVMM